MADIVAAMHLPRLARPDLPYFGLHYDRRTTLRSFMPKAPLLMCFGANGPTVFSGLTLANATCRPGPGRRPDVQTYVFPDGGRRQRVWRLQLIVGPLVGLALAGETTGGHGCWVVAWPDGRGAITQAWLFCCGRPWLLRQVLIQQIGS